MAKRQIFTLSIRCDNDAFASDALGEVQRILQATIEKMDHGITSGKCVDLNGNTVGEWGLS